MATSPAAGDIWGEDGNPARYGAWARDYPGYRETSRDLVRLTLPLDLPAASASARVLDLACGTGVTTCEILAVLGPGGRVTAVDKSAAMLGEAARSVTDPRVTWVNAAAETLDRQVTGPFAAVLCNSAIWQTQFAATARAVRAVITAGGRFAFSVPAGFLGDGNGAGTGTGHRPAERYPSLWSEMRTIAQSDYGWAPPARPTGRSGQRLSGDSVRRALQDAGFAAPQVTEISYPASAESEHAWLSIPVFTRSWLPGLPYEDRMRVLNEARARLGPGHGEQAQWVFFVAWAVVS